MLYIDLYLRLYLFFLTKFKELKVKKNKNRKSVSHHCYE